MSQPNASKMLKKMEERIGFQLFERTNGRLLPTEEARLIFDLVETTLLSLRRFHSLTEDIREMRKGSLTLGGLPLLSRFWLPRILAKFMQNYPRINTSLHTRSSRKLNELVAERQLDIGISMLASDDLLVECSQLTRLDFVTAIPKQHPLSNKKKINAVDLHGQDFISLSVLDHVREEIAVSLNNVKSVPNERCECSLPSVVLQLVENGIGIGLVDHISALEHKPHNIVFRPYHPLITMKIWMLRPRMKPGSMVVEKFIELMKQSIELDDLSNSLDTLQK